MPLYAYVISFRIYLFVTAIPNFKIYSSLSANSIRPTKTKQKKELPLNFNTHNRIGLFRHQHSFLITKNHFSGGNRFTIRCAHTPTIRLDFIVVLNQKIKWLVSLRSLCAWAVRCSHANHKNHKNHNFIQFDLKAGFDFVVYIKFNLNVCVCVCVAYLV